MQSIGRQHVCHMSDMGFLDVSAVANQHALKSFTPKPLNEWHSTYPLFRSAEERERIGFDSGERGSDDGHPWPPLSLVDVRHHHSLRRALYAQIQCNVIAGAELCAKRMVFGISTFPLSTGKQLLQKFVG